MSRAVRTRGSRRLACSWSVRGSARALSCGILNRCRRGASRSEALLPRVPGSARLARPPRRPAGCCDDAGISANSSSRRRCMDALARSTFKACRHGGGHRVAAGRRRDRGGPWRQNSWECGRSKIGRRTRGHERTGGVRRPLHKAALIDDALRTHGSSTVFGGADCEENIRICKPADRTQLHAVGGTGELNSAIKFFRKAEASSKNVENVSLERPIR